MKRHLFNLVCIVVISLSVYLIVSSEHAAADNLVSEAVESNIPSPKDVVVQQIPATSVATPNVDDAILQANESLSDDEPTGITELSLSNHPDIFIGDDPDSELKDYIHYIKQNDERYHAFQDDYPDLPVSTLLALVNVNADYGFYNNIEVIENPHGLLVLCSKNVQLSETFVPQNLRKITGTNYKMTDEAASAFERMEQAVSDELGLPLVVVSAYRDYSYQETLYNRYAKADGVTKADTYSARAGHSEHQTGLTLDFLHKSPSSSLRKANFQDTKQYEWLLQHAHEYGYILRYPEGYESVTGYIYEPWHWRYIGIEDATRMYESGIKTFDEYIGTYYSSMIPIISESGQFFEAG